ncbi:thioredoxin domain-containing protein [Pedobacter cryophilus]|uniref:Thioredoxin domain-containing protein n=1 Tax=Pedobacter cryophilus TaxID=2571271 RepID=A0A4U1C6Q5_9SPHI|nr:hypothetical protein [Pedobacter cryophilus]TKB99060.1 hypothetical protein FA046_08075 [Pedobacter cryophilus]
MKNFLITITIIVFGLSNVKAQKINYEKTLDAAKAKSEKLNKPLLIQITIQPQTQNITFPKEISIPEVVNKFNKEFINFKIDRADTAAMKIISRYKVNSFPAFIFLDSKGGLLLKDFGNFMQAQKYITMADLALSRSKEKSLVDYDKEYKAKGFDGDFLKNYISKRMNFGITDNALLLDQYVEFLRVADLNDYQQVLFILKGGPLAYGKAYRLAYINAKIIDSIFKTEPLAVRQTFNNAIINNTMAYAIAKKNIQWATAASNFTRTSWATDYRLAQKNSSLKMIDYYWAVKDTANYLRQASYFYDQHYMNISKDSIAKLNTKNTEEARKAAFEQAKRINPDSSFTTSFRVSYQTNQIPVELNNAAFFVFLTGTKNTNYINKAISWSKRSIELEPNYGFYDTLAHLLYRLDFYAEAEVNQIKAIELAKEKNINTTALQNELDKIKQRTL